MAGRVRPVRGKVCLERAFEKQLYEWDMVGPNCRFVVGLTGDTRARQTFRVGYKLHNPQYASNPLFLQALAIIHLSQRAMANDWAPIDQRNWISRSTPQCDALGSGSL